MNTNTLVKHKNLPVLGIGCISKVLSKKVRVNFGKDGTMTCNPNLLTPIDTSEAKTISFSELKRLSILNSESLPQDVIIGNTLNHWVGINWITTRVITENDLLKYPRVI